MLIPVVLVILSLMRPYHDYKEAMPILAVLPVSEFVVRPVQGICVFESVSVCSYKSVMISSTGVQSDGCVEYIALPGDAGDLDGGLWQ